MGGRAGLWRLGGALALLLNIAILPLLGSADGPDWDANIMPTATGMVGIATHPCWGSGAVHLTNKLSKLPYLFPWPQLSMRAFGALSEIHVGTQKLLLSQ